MCEQIEKLSDKFNWQEECQVTVVNKYQQVQTNLIYNILNWSRDIISIVKIDKELIESRINTVLHRYLIEYLLQLILSFHYTEYPKTNIFFITQIFQAFFS